MKKIVILKGSPRKNGNTNSLLLPFCEELKSQGAEYVEFDLSSMKIDPCIACRGCQRNWSIFGCTRKDDLQKVFDAIMDSDMIILATPIYSWFCTTPMKTALDRLVYGMNKYYGKEKGPALWEGKSLAMVVTCGYRPERGADLFEEAMRRYCKHSRLTYLGMICERHMGYETVFMDEKKEENARMFARSIM